MQFWKPTKSNGGTSFGSPDKVWTALTMNGQLEFWPFETGYMTNLHNFHMPSKSSQTAFVTFQ